MLEDHARNMGRFTGIFRVTTDKNSPLPEEPGSLMGLYENGARLPGELDGGLSGGQTGGGHPEGGAGNLVQGDDIAGGAADKGIQIFPLASEIEA